MQIIKREYEVYTFDELSEKAQEKVIENNYYNNVEHDWYQYTYDDAAQIGLKITEFNIDRGNCIGGKFTDYIEGVITAILNEHGNTTDTHILALDIKKRLDEIENKHNEDNNDDEYEDAKMDLENEFRQQLLECYLSSLRKEYEYLTSEQVIKESIISNECTFLIDGTPFN